MRRRQDLPSTTQFDVCPPLDASFIAFWKRRRKKRLVVLLLRPFCAKRRRQEDAAASDAHLACWL